MWGKMASDLTPFLSHKIDRSRASYFTHKEKLIILENFENYKDIIKTKGNTAAANRAKEDCWKRIAECVNSAGSSNVPRTWRQIKTKYKNLIQSAHRRRRRHIQETLSNQEGSPILQTLQGCAKSNSDSLSPQELFVQVDGDAMVFVEPHGLVSAPAKIADKDVKEFKAIFPEMPHRQAENIQTPKLPAASTPRPPEEELSLEALQRKNIELDNLKKQLEIQKLRLEIEKLEYEKKMRTPLL